MRQVNSRQYAISRAAIVGLTSALPLIAAAVWGQESNDSPITYQEQVQPLFQKYCVRCHNADEMTSGIRVDHLDGAFEDKQLFLWKDVVRQIVDEAMPPDDELQPTALERARTLPGVVDVRAKGAIGVVQLDDMSRIDWLKERFVDEPWPGIAILDAWNVDWEDITFTDGHLYIGDVGNNGNGRRDEDRF